MAVGYLIEIDKMRNHTTGANALLFVLLSISFCLPYGFYQNTQADIIMRAMSTFLKY